MQTDQKAPQVERASPEAGKQISYENAKFGQLMAQRNQAQNPQTLVANLATNGNFASNHFLDANPVSLAEQQLREGYQQLVDQCQFEGSDKAHQFRTQHRAMLQAVGVKESAGVSSYVLEEQQLDQHARLLAQAKDRYKQITADDSFDSETASKEDDEANKDSRQHSKEVKRKLEAIRAEAKFYLPDAQDLDSIEIGELVKRVKASDKFKHHRKSKSLEKQIFAAKKSNLDSLKKELLELNEIVKGQSKEDLQAQIQLFELSTQNKRQKKDGKSEKEHFDIENVSAAQLGSQLKHTLESYLNLSQKQEEQKSRSKSQIAANKKRQEFIVRPQNLEKVLGSYMKKEDILNLEARNKKLVVKVVGLQTKDLTKISSKYCPRVDNLPPRGSVFDMSEEHKHQQQSLGGIQGSLSTQGPVINLRADGKQLISLPQKFNPLILESKMRKKLNETVLKEYKDQRNKYKNTKNEKLEGENLKRAWVQIAKKDIPKAYKQFQKQKQDQDNTCKKLSTNVSKEIKKKAQRTMRLQKEYQNRAKKLFKDVTVFWRKRDKEINETKKKKEKLDKEYRKRLEEEKEAEIKKKQLEFLMKQSDIYSHFMAKNLNPDAHIHDSSDAMLMTSRVQVDEEKAASNIASMVNERRKELAEFDQSINQEKKVKNLKEVKESDLQVNKFEAEETSMSKFVQQPKIFRGQLKHYQLQGLRWLDNLYDQGINGILADEMGLGKTIQSIALLANIAERKNIWGPFLIVAPSSTLPNWQRELQLFCPSFRVIPYFGALEERKNFRKFMQPKDLYSDNPSVNVVITSYTMISTDEKYLARVKWNCMILDEAQAIKNNQSQRWQTLTTAFQARMKTLLSGTPIQNSMNELWALLHFIMPKLFNSLEQFQEWFSKDIEAHSMNQGELNQEQLKRLHAVLKPFMLRRLKRDVESEIGPKTEYEIMCDMTHRQRTLYRRIKEKISVEDLFQLADNKAKMDNLMNLVMQLRKVCNHPDLFERRIAKVPFSFNKLQVGMGQNPNLLNLPEIAPKNANPISVTVPKLIFDDLYFEKQQKQTGCFTKFVKGRMFEHSSVSKSLQNDLFNIFNTNYIHEQTLKSGSRFGILRLLQLANKWSPSTLSYFFRADPIMSAIALMQYFTKKQTLQLSQFQSHPKDSSKVNIDLQKLKTSFPYCTNFVQSELNPVYSPCTQDKDLQVLQPLVSSNMKNWFGIIRKDITEMVKCVVPRVLAAAPELNCSSSSFRTYRHATTQNQAAKRILLGYDLKLKLDKNQGKSPMEQSLVIANPFQKEGVMQTKAPLYNIELPKYNRLVTDCAKLQALDKLLQERYAGGHRVLLFSQSTQMLSILEDFFSWRQYTYFRLDGSTPIQDRRFMTEEFQKSNRVFAFLLSTRAGGLGINLIAADTVIFYDIDWNPTMDAQATDRAHRIGQTKPVSVYRLLTRGTVEEKILKRAKQKENVQQTVYSGNALKADFFKPSEVKDFLLDDEEKDQLKSKGLLGKKKQIKKVHHPDQQEQQEQAKKEKEEEKKKAKEEKKKVKRVPKPQQQQNGNIFAVQKGGAGQQEQKNVFNVQKPVATQQQQQALFSTQKAGGLNPQNPVQGQQNPHQQQDLDQKEVYDEMMEEEEDYDEEGEDDEEMEEDEEEVLAFGVDEEDAGNQKESKGNTALD